MSDRVARLGIAVLLSLWAALVLVEVSRAEVPPLISDVRQLVNTVRRVLDRPEAPRHASAVPGMCEQLPELDAQDDIPERVEVERVLAKCSRAGRHSDPWAVRDLLRLERDLGVPADARLSLVAAVCVESGFRTDRPMRGDWRDGSARGHGPFQLWPSIRAWCRFAEGGADSLEASGRCYWARVEDRREVRALGCAHSWRVGEALAANGPAYLPWKCSAKSAHWSAMEAMR